jgi:hypothetical protein
MGFVVLNYGIDVECWDSGVEIGQMIDGMIDSSPEEYQKIMQSSLNVRWYETYKNNKNDWPHPNKILIGLTKISPFIDIDWIPELNYLGVFIQDDKVLSFLKSNFSEMLDTEAIK